MKIVERNNLKNVDLLTYNYFNKRSEAANETLTLRRRT
jgi:hypothetical protein